MSQHTWNTSVINNFSWQTPTHPLLLDMVETVRNHKKQDYCYSLNSIPRDNRGILILGKKTERKKAAKLLNQTFENKVNIKWKGKKITNISIKDGKTLSEKQQIVFNTFSKVINNDQVTKFKAVSGKKREKVIGGAARDKIQLLDFQDMIDTENITDGKISALGIFVHEVEEAYQIQQEGIDYNDGAHQAGLDVQSEIDGYESMEGKFIRNGSSHNSGYAIYHVIVKKTGKVQTIDYKIEKGNPTR